MHGRLVKDLSEIPEIKNCFHVTGLERSIFFKLRVSIKRSRLQKFNSVQLTIILKPFLYTESQNERALLSYCLQVVLKVDFQKMQFRRMLHTKQLALPGILHCFFVHVISPAKQLQILHSTLNQDACSIFRPANIHESYEIHGSG